MKEIIKKIVAKILEWEARLVLARQRPKIIAVTGSVGKTSAKDLIYTVVRSTFTARKNEKSLNSEFGVPLTILNLKSAWSSPILWFLNLCFGLWRSVLPGEKFKFLVLEIGADHPGDIKYLSSWTRPKIGIITGMGNEIPVHVEFFPDIESLGSEKSELLRVLPEDGRAILNRDDARVWDMRAESVAKITSYGFSPGANIHADNFHTNFPKGISFRVDYAGKSIPVRLSGVIGRGAAYAALAAFAVGTELGINVVTIAEALGKHQFAPGRMRILEGYNNSTLIDDTYNSSPAAVKLALETLHDINLDAEGPSGPSASKSRKIVVLGDMLELGIYSEQEHKKVGTWIRGIADMLVCVGERAKMIGESAIEDGFDPDQVHYCSNSYQAGQLLVSSIQQSDIVLLKASQSIRLERATEMLLADPSHSHTLLVRQEKEWKRKI